MVEIEGVRIVLGRVCRYNCSRTEGNKSESVIVRLVAARTRERTRERTRARAPARAPARERTHPRAHPEG